MNKKTAKSIPTAPESGNVMVYVAQADRISGDSFDLACAYDLEAAREAIQSDIHHLTPRELSGTRHCINGWIIPVEAGETAGEAYCRWSDDLCDYPNQDYCEVIEH